MGVTTGRRPIVRTLGRTGSLSRAARLGCRTPLEDRASAVDPRDRDDSVVGLAVVEEPDPDAPERRLNGLLVAADVDSATIRVGILDDGAPDDRVIPISGIDRARTVFEWGPAPKPGGPRKGARSPKSSNDRRQSDRDTQDITPSTTEETP